MKTSTCAWSLVAGLALLATPLHAQRVSAEVVVRGGPVAGRVAVNDGYSSYRPPVRRVVVERHAPRMLRGEMRGAELDHLAGADEQHMLFGDIAENTLRQPHCGTGHGNRIGANVGGGTYFLGYGKGALEQLV